MKRFSSVFSLIICLLILNIAACGGSSGGGDNGGSPEDPLREANPVVQTQIFGQNGNLYKPRADDHGAGNGNLVVLLSPTFTKQFESCSIKKASGEVSRLICINDQPWTQIPYSCFSNGNRQTWRASFPCHEAGEVKVTCKDTNQEVVFTVPEAARGSVCSRFG